ncbi:MAG: putative methanosis marker protein 7 [Methanomicrobia archaeon]|nr:putative methanosis marker protein 7 [Methanomicrobia archaeon]
MLEPVMFTGGLYKHDLIVELVEDLGGYILQKNVAQSEIILLILVPSEDKAALEALAKELRGELVRAPLAGTETAVVTPTLAIHHLPHTACDIAEYLRRHGSKTNMMGLARGVGREIAQINEYETALINEHDAAVFIYGNFQECIKHKEKLYQNISIPVVVTGGPQKATEIGTLDRIVEAVGRALDKTRASIAKDPLTTSPPRIMDAVREQVPDVEFSYSPLPIALNLTGVRVKLPYSHYKDEVAAVKFDEGVRLGEIATIRPSQMKDYILVRILPSSETGFVF